MMWLATNATVCCLTRVRAWLFCYHPTSWSWHFWTKFYFSLTFYTLVLRFQNTAIRKMCSQGHVLCSVQQQHFLFPFPTSWLPFWSSWPVECTQVLLITVWECVCRRVHILSFLCIILQNRQDNSQPVGLKSCSFPKKIFLAEKSTPSWSWNNKRVLVQAGWEQWPDTFPVCLASSLIEKQMERQWAERPVGFL